MASTRLPLSEILPLDIPISMQIAASMMCNLKCEFCSQSEEANKENLKNGSKISLKTIQKLVDDLVPTGKKLKNIEFSGIGEPLLCKELPEMISYIKKKQVCDHVVVVSNATLLDETWSHALIGSGLDQLRLSINGLSKEDYLKNTGVAIEFDEMLSNIRLFYQMSRNTGTNLYIKIMDYMVESEEKKKFFQDTFGPISDELNIEHLIKTSPYVDYETKFGDRIYNLNQKSGSQIVETEICPRSFFDSMLCVNGDLMACCYGLWNPQSDLIMGNIGQESFVDIWNGRKFNDFRIKMLEGVQHASPTCVQCPVWRNQICKEDVLDGVKDTLKLTYGGEK